MCIRDSTSATLTSTDPYYWTSHNDITITAWWPYTEGETTPPAVKVKANQSAQKDFEGSDLIVADGQTVTYGSPTLRFTHRTARVTIVPVSYTHLDVYKRQVDTYHFMDYIFNFFRSCIVSVAKRNHAKNLFICFSCLVNRFWSRFSSKSHSCIS